MAHTIIYLTLLTLALALTEARNLHKRHADPSLELVHVIFRHGDRTPDRGLIYPTDPHSNHTYHPVGFGQLTNAGKRKEYLVGIALYKRYGKFLGTYNIENVDARCTDYNRTKMSLQLVLASLFPPKDDLVWEKRLKWQPVPFNYWDIMEDHLLGESVKNCPKYQRLFDEFVASEEGRNIYRKVDNISDYISQHSGTNMTVKKLANMYFTLTTERENGLKLPDWTKKFYPDSALNLAVVDYETSTGTDELKRLSSGFLVRKIINDSREKMKKMKQSDPEQNTKMHLYSAHEYNLAFLLRYLGVFYAHVPPYGSYLSIEIHNVNGVRGVKVFYQDYKSDKPRRLKLPGCETFCRFEKFVRLYQALLPENENECFE